MSLLDDVSIVVTPNGYKAGELYAVVPVPSEGAEEVTNGDFASGTTGWSAYQGSLSVSNGNLVVTATANSDTRVRTQIATVVGKSYILTAELKSMSGTKVGVANANNSFSYSGNVQELTSTGSYSYYFTAAYTNTSIVFKMFGASTGETFSLDNVSVKEYTAADMDVTRATAATRVDEAGLVNYAEIIGSEEVTNGDFATDSDWTKNSGWTISGGTANKDSVDINYLTQDFSGNGQFRITYTISSYVSGDVRLRVGTGFSTSVRTSNGTYTEYITKDSASFGFYGGGEFSIDNVSVKEVTRDNVPRIDYTGGGCPHILAEPQRTNLIPYSEDFTDSSWIKSGTTINPNNATSPDGTTNASTINFSASSQYLLRNQNVTFAIGDSISTSIYANTSTVGFLSFGGATPSGTDVANVETLGGGFYRHTLTRTFTASGTSVQFIIWDAAIGNYVIWGAQLEEGSYATSYIPTSGSTVTRNQDQFSRDGIGSLINSEEGVLFAELNAGQVNDYSRYLGLSDGSTGNRVILGVGANTSNITCFISSSGTVAAFNFAVDITLTHKVALTWKLNDFKLYVNGVLRQTDTSGVTPVGLNQLFYGNGVSNSQPFFGKVKQLQVYKTALTDTQLAALTS